MANMSPEQAERLATAVSAAVMSALTEEPEPTQAPTPNASSGTTGSGSGLRKRDRVYNEALDDVLETGREYSDDTVVRLSQVRDRIESLRRR